MFHTLCMIEAARPQDPAELRRRPVSETIDGVTLPRVHELLQLAELERGKPEVWASPSANERPVRWAHVVAGRVSADLLDGQEFLLTTGADWPTGGPALKRLVTELCDAGVSALVLELGTRFHTPPPELREVLEARDIAFIALHRQVKFVQLTQAIHRRILSAQHEALEAKEHVHHLFTELGLNRSPVDYMIEHIAATMQAPVVLENTSGQVIAWSSPRTGASAEHVLAPWAGGRYEATSDASALRVPVEAQGVRWGMLTALEGPPHPAGRHTVLELGATAVALRRLADGTDEWLQLSAKHLFDTLLGGRYRNDTELMTQLTAAGLPFEKRSLFGLSLTGSGDFGSHVSLERAIAETALRRAIAPEGFAMIADDPDAQGAVSLLALVSLPDTDERAHLVAERGVPPLIAERLDRELDMLVPGSTPAEWRAHLSLGTRSGDQRSAATLRGLLTSIEGVRAAGTLPATATAGRVTVQEATGQPLAYLLRDLEGSQSLQHFVDSVLGPVLDHDRGRGPGHTGDLTEVLAAYLATPTNRSLAATRARLSRSVFYQRLALIEELLGVDLSDGGTITTLTVALTAHGLHS